MKPLRKCNENSSLLSDVSEIKTLTGITRALENNQNNHNLQLKAVLSVNSPTSTQAVTIFMLLLSCSFIMFSDQGLRKNDREKRKGQSSKGAGQCWSKYCEENGATVSELKLGL